MLRHIANLLALALLIGNATAQVPAPKYPSRPIHIIVPFGAGTSVDLTARMVAKRLADEFAQPVVVENRVGASGILGAEAVANAAADGYTLLLGSNSVFTHNAVTFAKLPYNPLKSFSPVSMVAAQPLIVAVNPSVSARSVAELVSLAKSRPEQITCGTLGSVHQLTMAYFSKTAGIRLLEVPYKSGAITALVTGEINLMFEAFATVAPQARAGKVRALAVTTEKRSPLAPELPTVAELGYPGFDASSWNGLVAPAGTPKSIIEQLNREMVRMLASADLKELLIRQGVEARSSTPEELGERIRIEIARWQKVASDAGLSPQ